MAEAATKIQKVKARRQICPRCFRAVTFDSWMKTHRLGTCAIPPPPKIKKS